MPYSNIPESKWPAMDRCVTRVMDEQGLPKERAIAICHASIMGDKKKIDMPSQVTFNINLNDYWKSRMEEEAEDNEEDEGEIEQKINMEGGEQMIKQEEETLKAMAGDMKACVMGHMKEGKSMKESQAMCEKEMEGKKVAKQDEGGEEAPAEETPVEEAPVEEKKEEATEEKPAEEVPAPAEGEVKEEVVEADPVGDLLKQVLAKVDEIQSSLKKEEEASVEATEESAPAEGAAEEAPAEEVSAEAAPEGGVAEAPVEEAPAGASTEGTEEVAKISDSLTKIADSIATLEKRINALEEQPAPSKVVSPKVVTKGEEVGGDNPNQDRLDEIKTELSKLEEMKDKETEKYQKERAWEKAFDLMAERDRLLKV